MSVIPTSEVPVTSFWFKFPRPLNITLEGLYSHHKFLVACIFFIFLRDGGEGWSQNSHIKAINHVMTSSPHDTTRDFNMTTVKSAYNDP